MTASAGPAPRYRFLVPLLVTLAVAVFVFSLVTTPFHPVPQAPSLIGTSWMLVSLDNGNGTLRTVTPGSNVTASFMNEGLLAGRAGCNWYSANYTVTGSSSAITVGTAVRTAMACHDPLVMAQEDRYMDSLGRWAGYQIPGTKLIITDSSGKTILEFSQTG
ncbi:MAG: META domain-containing protein [Methanoregulaceae archaeon]